MIKVTVTQAFDYSIQHRDGSVTTKTCPIGSVFPLHKADGDGDVRVLIDGYQFILKPHEFELDISECIA